MKKIIVILSTVLFIVGCKPKDGKKIFEDDKPVVADPSDKKEALVLIGKYMKRDMTVYIYRSFGDTIYIVEGNYQSYPISIMKK